MQTRVTINNLAQPFWPVKSNETIIIGSAPLSMTHHRVFLSKRGKLMVVYSKDRCKAYGVSSSQKLISPQLLLKRFDQVRDFLEGVLCLTAGERENTLNMLRLQAYYGYVYLKAGMFADQPGCSKSTFWRTIRKLKGFKIIGVTNRFVFREHAQISNLYILDKLLMLIAEYLAKHLAQPWPPYFIPCFNMNWAEFEKFIETMKLKLPFQYGDGGAVSR